MPVDPNRPVPDPDRAGGDPVGIGLHICRSPRVARTPMIELLCYEPGIYAVDAGYLRPHLSLLDVRSVGLNGFS